VRSFIVSPYLVVYRPRGRSIEILRVIRGARDRTAAWREPSNGGDPPADL
jgi:plasmid stabilization system protein ParE